MSEKMIIQSRNKILEPVPLPIVEEEVKVESNAASAGTISAEIECIYRDIKKIMASTGKHSDDKTFSGSELVAKAKKLGLTGKPGKKEDVIAFIVDKYTEYEAMKDEATDNYDDINVGVDSDEDGNDSGEDSDDYYE